MTLKSFFLKKCAIALALAVSAVFCMEAQAQFAGMMISKSKKSRSERATIPTTVNSDSMDIDIAHDKVTLLGNVEVNDPEMNIKCQKMVIFLENRPVEKTEEKKDGKKEEGKDAKKADGSSLDPEVSKQVTRIECTGDVVISRQSTEKVAGSEVQKAYAGKAVYDLPKDTITLTENNPVIVSGPNRLAGEKIEVNVKTERIIVIGARSQTAGGLLKN